MRKTIDSLKTDLQRFFSDGLAVVAGSGLSAAEGMPSMSMLEAHLKDEVPKLVSGKDSVRWEAIADALKDKKGLESALLAVAPTPELEEVIVRLTAELIESAEAVILAEVIAGNRELPFSKLLPHLNPQPNRAIPVITTNYDRLIEIAAEIIGWGVDSMFVGNTIGTLDPIVCARSFLKEVQVKTKRLVYSYRNRISLTKPHGSLDWFQHPKFPLRCAIKLPLPRLIITPGRNKYHRGYAIPFDKHREGGNAALDKAARLLILGFGFNDDHLETHLSPSIKLGKPSLILCRSLSANAAKVVSESPNAMALSQDPGHPNGFLLTTKSGEMAFDLAPIWQVSTFVDHILNP